MPIYLSIHTSFFVQYTVRWTRRIYLDMYKCVYPHHNIRNYIWGTAKRTSDQSIFKVIIGIKYKKKIYLHFDENTFNSNSKCTAMQNTVHCPCVKSVC